MKYQNIQAVFWDFDGVIADSTDVKTRAFEEMFAPYGEDVARRVLNYHLEHGGISRVEKIDHAFRHFIGQPLSATELEEKCEAFSNVVKQKVIEAPLISGAIATLEALSPQIPMFVISGTPQEELVEIARARNLDQYFKRILGSPAKKPEHVTRLLKEFDLDPRACVFIGDAMTDYNAAQACGTQFIGIKGFNAFPESTVELPDCTGILDALARIQQALSA